MILLIGCFGNSDFDRSMELELNRYLDSIEDNEHLCDYEPDPDEKHDDTLPENIDSE